MKKALEDNYLCRSAYKLIELDDRFHFLQPGRVVIDCGASPGNFLITVQVTLLLKTNLMIINLQPQTYFQRLLLSLSQSERSNNRKNVCCHRLDDYSVTLIKKFN